MCLNKKGKLDQIIKLIVWFPRLQERRAQIERRVARKVKATPNTIRLG